MTAAAALLAGVMMTSASSAAPASSSQAIASHVNGSDATVQTVRRGGRHGHWRGHRRHRHGGWGGGGWGAAAAAGLLLSAPLWAGGTYAYDEPYDYSYGGTAYSYGGEARCEATFRSYDPSSGTYMGYDGVRRMCPYL